MSTTEHVLVVGGGTGILAIHRPDCRTSVICQLPVVTRLHPEGLRRHSRVVGLPVDSPDGEWIAAAAEIHARDPFTRVATLGEEDQRRAARIGAALGLRTHPPEVADAVCDKHLMRRVLAEAGVENVPAARLGGAGELADWLREHPGDWIVKPVTGSASAGVSRVSGPGDAAAAYARCESSHHPGGRSGEVLVEQFLHGVQVSAEAVSEAGEHCVVALTRKYSDPVTYVEVGHVVPADLSAAQRDAVVAHTVRVLDALGVRDGVTHTELVLTPSGPRVLETHLRLAGDQIPELVREVTGVDLLDCALRQLFGESTLADVRSRLAEPPRDAEAIWFAVPPCGGVLTDVAGVAAAEAAPGVLRVARLISDGTAIRGLTDSLSRVVAVRAQGADPRTAIRRARDAAAMCRLQMDVAAVSTDDLDGLA